jgi:hypothetical protein
MPKLTQKIPSYRLHKGIGQAVVTLSGREVYLGLHNTPRSRKEYDRVIAEWIARGRVAPDEPNPTTGITVVELIAAFLDWADTYYRRADGTPTGETGTLIMACRPLKALYETTPAADFGPKKLGSV